MAIQHDGFGTILSNQETPASPAGGSSGSTVVWAPFRDPGSGYVTTFAEAVTAVQGMSPGNEIRIDADPWDPDNHGPVIIPAGVWELNDTTIVGKTTYAHGGLDWQSRPPGDGNHGSPWQGSTDPFRGQQILLAVYTQGHSDSTSAYDNPCRLNGVRGMRDIFFRGEMYAANPSGTANLAVSGTTVTVTRVSGNLFSKVDASEVPTTITLSGTANGNDGSFTVTSFNTETGAITYENESAQAELGVTWTMERVNAVFVNNQVFGPYSDFILDNVDFRQGGSSYGTFYVGEDGRSFVKLRNAASWRNGCSTVNGHLVIQSDGTPCRIGIFSTNGSGWAKFYLSSGTEFSNAQCITYDVYQSTIWYTPADDTKWSGTPSTHHEALDQLAQRLYALEHPGP